MERVMIIGGSGAGKSTLARMLGEKLGLPVVHLDQIWWKPGWVESEREEFDEKVRKEMEKPRWVIDGNYSRTIEMRIEKADTIIYLDFSRFACLRGVLMRYLQNMGRTRVDMPEGCPEKIDWEFICFVWNFNKRNRERTYRWLNEAEGKETIVLKNRRAVKRFLEQL